MSANERQEGGSHYQTGAVQHWDLIARTASGYLEGCATKYLTRWRKKNGLQDLRKSLHYLEKLQEEAARGTATNRSYFQVDVLKEKAEGTLQAFFSDAHVGPAEELAIANTLYWKTAADLDGPIQLVLGLIKEVEDDDRKSG